MRDLSPLSISPAALASVLAGGDIVTLLDVRTHSEYASAHVPGANLTPLQELNAAAFLAQHPAGRPIYVLCQSGMRASKAIEQLQNAGCNDCIRVEGGTQAWIDAGLPVHRGVAKTLPIMRQVQIVVGTLAVLGSVLGLLVSRWFVLLPLLLGGGLLFAGISGTCGMALLLAGMPWNRGQGRCAQCSTPKGSE